MTAMRVWAMGAALLLCASSASAYFEEIEPDARSLALGRAAGADVSGPSAVYWNPALLVRGDGLAAQVTSTHLYAVSDLVIASLAARVPLGSTPVAAAWHTTRLRDALTEDVVTLGAARARGRYAVGGALEVARVALAGAARDGIPGASPSETKVTGTVGVAYDPRPTMTVGAVVRHLAEPRVSLLGGSGSGSAPRQSGMQREAEVHWRYRWDPSSTVVAALTHDDDNNLRHSLGGEIVFSDVFVLRTGLSQWQLTGGLGLNRPHWAVDVAFVTHKELGNSYRFTFAFGPGVRRP